MSVAHPNVRCWVVEVSVEDVDPMQFGPYTERKARQLVDGFNAAIDSGVVSESDYGWIHATAKLIANPQSVRALVAEFQS